MLRAFFKAGCFQQQTLRIRLRRPVSGQDRV